MNAALAGIFSKIWAANPEALAGFFAECSAVPVDARLDDAKPPESNEMEIRDGVAHVSVTGPVLKKVPEILRYFGISATSTVEVKDQIETASLDDAVSKIVLHIDSPGGTVQGLQELADTIREARDIKPIDARIPDLGASAAYWIAAQAGQVIAGPSAMVGSIGVFTRISDFSAMFEREGIKVHVISSHELKGAGVIGSPVTEAQIKDQQRLIDEIADQFVKAVSLGRRMPETRVRDSATGQVWMGSELVRRGLVDRIESLNSFTKRRDAAKTTMEATAMSDTTQPTNAELVAKLEKLEADSAKRGEELAALRRDQRSRVLDQYADHYEPAIRGKLEEIGSDLYADNLKGFEAYLAAMPKVGRADPVSDPGGGPQKGKPANKALEEHDAYAASVFGIKSADWQELEPVVGDDFEAINWDGSVQLKDGSTVEV